jgi:predicted transcriptional regulator
LTVFFNCVILLENSRDKGQDMNLSVRQNEMLEALRQAKGQWLTRAELAAATGKRNLSQNDTFRLSELEQAGIIQIQQVPARGATRLQYQYRVKDES